MRWMSLIAAAAAATGLAAPAAANDLAYRHQQDGPSLLEGSNGRPYWLLLSECAGFYGAMANTATDETRSQENLRTGVTMFELAVSRLRIDRGLDQAAAVALMEPYIERARLLGESNLAADPSDGADGRLSPRVVMTSTCNSLRLAYDTAIRS